MSRPRRIAAYLVLAFVLACVGAASSRASARPARPTLRRLAIEPASLQLVGPRALAHPLVTATFSNGEQRDISAKGVWSAPPNSCVRVDRDGVLHPVRDGAATVKFSYAGHAATVRVTVKGAKEAVPISFKNEIEPALTRAGCNQGSCHGAQYGKGGFKLSLAGFDSDLDYQNIVKQGRSRRIAIADPTHSLILLKPTMSVPHGGGRRLEPGSPDYRLLAQWIRSGAPGPDPADPQITKLEVFPSERIMEKGAAPQRLFVRATYDNGMTRDVTEETRLATLNDAVAACTPEGVVAPVNKGQTAIMARYGGLATVATIIVPFGPNPPTPFPGRSFHSLGKGETRTRLSPFPVSAANAVGKGAGGLGSARLDALVARKQRQLRLAPSDLCDDATFLRRVSFDLIGTPPTADEMKTFLADSSPDKRARAVDALLARPEYADYWSLKWSDLLRSNRTTLGAKGMWSFDNWIHAQFAQNRPFDQFTHDLLLAQGSTFTNGPANFYRVARDPQDLAETTSQVFLGVRLQCARCHHHPFEKWSQEDYYQFAAFFARVGIKGSTEFGIFGGEQVVKINDGGEVRLPKTGAIMRPTPLGVTLATLPDGKAPNPDADGDRRRALADWLTSKNNRMFARNIVNRYWGYLFGKGIINPIDDIRVTNPPTDPELLEALTDELIAHHFDIKYLLRLLCNTQTYQRSSNATRQNRQDELFFTHYLPKRLPAETLLDAIDFACGTHEKFNGLPEGVRAIQLPDPAVGSDFLDTFGRPQRLIACECERVAEPNLSQTLHLMNGELINHKVSEADGRIATLIKAHRSNDVILNDLYMAALGRSPSRRERLEILGVLLFSKDREPVFEDVLVTLLNSKEFLFNH